MILCHAIRVGFKHKMSRKFPLGYGYTTEVIFYGFFSKKLLFIANRFIYKLVARTPIFVIALTLNTAIRYTVILWLKQFTFCR